MKDGMLTVVVGRTRSGKTLSTRRGVQQASPLLVFDPKDEWRSAGCVRVSSSDLLGDRLLGLGRDPARQRLSYVPTITAAFSWWASAAFVWARLAPGTTIVAEELSAYTHPGKAPPGWHRLLTQGLGYGTKIWALMQRPAEADKTCFGNASRLRCFALSRALDRAYMAREMDCDPEDLARLKPLEYLEKNLLSAKISRGRVYRP